MLSLHTPRDGGGEHFPPPNLTDFSCISWKRAHHSVAQTSGYKWTPFSFSPFKAGSWEWGALAGGGGVGFSKPRK